VRHRLRVLSWAVTAVAIALPSLPVPAGAAEPAKAPKVSYVSPMRVSVGGTLRLRGRGFSAVRLRNTVIFRSPRRSVVLAKPTRSSARKLVLKVPVRIRPLLAADASGSKRATRFKLRVVVGRRASRWTSPIHSPVVW
jgi:hypothetical protein